MSDRIPLKATILKQRILAIVIVWCVLLSISFSGCAYVGHSSSRSNLNEETASRIIPGKTTRAEVLAMLGQPDEISENGKQLTYVKKYELALISPGGLNPATRYLFIIDFDEQGIVARRIFISPYEFHDKPIHEVPPFNSPPSYR